MLPYGLDGGGGDAYGFAGGGLDAVENGEDPAPMLLKSYGEGTGARAAVAGGGGGGYAD